MGNSIQRYLHPDVYPGFEEQPTFPTDYGFEAKRTQRVMIATDEQMMAAKLPMEFRDYCAHKLIEYQQCRRSVFPLVYKCAHEKHTYLQCEHDDYVMRLKEFERERRLRERQKRLVDVQ